MQVESGTWGQVPALKHLYNVNDNRKMTGLKGVDAHQEETPGPTPKPLT